MGSTFPADDERKSQGMRVSFLGEASFTEGHSSGDGTCPNGNILKVFGRFPWAGVWVSGGLHPQPIWFGWGVGGRVVCGVVGQWMAFFIEKSCCVGFACKTVPVGDQAFWTGVVLAAGVAFCGGGVSAAPLPEAFFRLLPCRSTFRPRPSLSPPPQWPAVHIAGWFDVFQQDQLRVFDGYHRPEFFFGDLGVESV